MEKMMRAVNYETFCELFTGVWILYTNIQCLALHIRMVWLKCEMRNGILMDIVRGMMNACHVSKFLYVEALNTRL